MVSEISFLILDDFDSPNRIWHLNLELYEILSYVVDSILTESYFKLELFPKPTTSFMGHFDLAVST